MKRYFIWKDANCNGINPEWKEITGSEYFALVKTEPQRRLMPFDKDGDYCEDDFWYEVTNEVYMEWDKTRKQKKRDDEYLKKNIKFVSFDDLVSLDDEEGLTWAEVIPDTRDEEAFAEEQNRAYRLWLRSLLPEALQLLDQDQMNVINWLYLDESGYIWVADKKTGQKRKKQKSEKKVAEEHNLPEKTLNNRKNAAFRIMRDFFLKKMAEK